MPKVGQTCKYGRHVWNGYRWEELKMAENNPEKPLRIVFAQMDCKNQTAVSTDYPYMPYRGRNTDEERILRDAELEYLLAVRDLQAKIREKYMPLLMEDREDPESEVRLVNNEHYRVHRAERDKVRSLYYT